MGFIIQARDTQTDEQVGTWTFEGDDIRTMTCNNGNVHITHSELGLSSDS